MGNIIRYFNGKDYRYTFIDQFFIFIGFLGIMNWTLLIVYIIFK
jgi:hypothetical protein